MSDAVIVEPTVVSEMAGVSHSPFSWSAAIAGTLAAMAVSFIVVALGSGIGLSFASPYSGFSATSLTVAAAVWLVLAQALGFATGGYLAGRLRSSAFDELADETLFRDAAQGFVVWAIGTVIMVAGVTFASYLAASATSQAVSNAAGSAAMMRSVSDGGPTTGSATDYFVDLVLRPDPATAGGRQPDTTVGAAAQSPASSNEVRAEVTRILVRAVAQAKLDDNDRSYLARIVAARTGLPADQAESRVAEVENKAREAVKETADKARKAAAFFSFWAFMSLLVGGAAATLAGIAGGQLRDGEGPLGAAD